MPPEPQMVTGEFALEGPDFSLKSRVTIPAGPTRQRDLLPLARALSDAVVGQACQAVAEAGEVISCTKGCGACCKNLVAISEVEARRIGQVVEEMPEPRRSVVRQRFAAAREALDAAGLLPQLQGTEQITTEEYGKLVGTYFAAGVACPFLDDGACSIYAERPITCREFLVTSPPEFCDRVDSSAMRQVRLPLRVFNAVARWQVPPTGDVLERWVPLILAPEWAAAHPDEPPPLPGPDLLRELLGHLQVDTPAADGQ